jgi:hypothetical protein
MMQSSLDFTAAYPPHQHNSDTSRESAKAVAPNFSARMMRILEKISSVGGMTDEEGQYGLEIDGNSYRPARVTLAKHGLILDSGERRKTNSGRNAVVWEITHLGMSVLREAR